jgi:hypothetical protein
MAHEARPSGPAVLPALREIRLVTRRQYHRRRPDPGSCPKCGIRLLTSCADVACPQCGGCTECCPHLEGNPLEHGRLGLEPPSSWGIRQVDPDDLEDEDQPFFWNRRLW